MNSFEHMQLPVGWTTAAVGGVGRVRYGLGQPPELDDSGVAMIRATNIKRGRISSVGLIRIKRSAIPESRNAFLKEGDVLVVRSGAYTGDVAMVTKPWVDSVAGYDLILSLGDNVDPSYCAFALRSAEVQNYFKSQSARSAQPHLNRQQLNSTLIPVPPLAEQRKIAGVLGLVQRALEQQERLIALTTELKKALLHQLFTQGLRGESQKQTEIGPVPQSWEQRPLEQAGDVVYGIQAAVASNLKPVGTKILTNKNITLDGRITLEKINYFVLKTPRHHATVLRKGDLLFNWRSGSKEHVGKTAYFDLDGQFTHSSFILRIRPHDEVSGRYLFWRYDVCCGSRARPFVLARRVRYA